MAKPGNRLTHAALLPLKLIGRRSLPVARRATGWLAGPLNLLMRRRRRIVERNLELCFPELDPAARRALARGHFRQLAAMIGETAFAWHRPGTLGPEIGEVVGMEYLEAARGDGRGVLLLTAHMTCLELGARLFGELVTARAIYRPLANQALEAFQNRGRSRYAEAMIPKHDLRAMLRHLRAGGVLWFAPDQDLGPERSHFAPFFGIPTATATSIVELARLGRAAVVPMLPRKDESGRVTVYLEPAFEDFPSVDPETDLARYNAFVERHVRAAPDQYWWLHRRFKTAPAGAPPRYPDS